MALSERKIEVLNQLAQMSPEISQSRPAQYAETIRAFVDDLRVNYPEVGDDDLASLLFDQAQGLSYVLACVPLQGLPQALSGMIINLGQGAVELSRLTRDQEI